MRDSVYCCFLLLAAAARGSVRRSLDEIAFASPLQAPGVEHGGEQSSGVYDQAASPDAAVEDAYDPGDPTEISSGKSDSTPIADQSTSYQPDSKNILKPSPSPSNEPSPTSKAIPDQKPHNPDSNSDQTTYTDSMPRSTPNQDSSSQEAADQPYAKDPNYKPYNQEPDTYRSPDQESIPADYAVPEKIPPPKHSIDTDSPLDYERTSQQQIDDKKPNPPLGVPTSISVDHPTHAKVNPSPKPASQPTATAYSQENASTPHQPYDQEPYAPSRQPAAQLYDQENTPSPRQPYNQEPSHPAQPQENTPSLHQPYNQEPSHASRQPAAQLYDQETSHPARQPAAQLYDQEPSYSARQPPAHRPVVKRPLNITETTVPMPGSGETPVIRIEVQQPPPAPTVTQTITRMLTVMATETQIIHRFIDPSSPQPTGTLDPKEHQRVAILVTDTPTRTHYSHQMANFTLPGSHHKKPSSQDTD